MTKNLSVHTKALTALVITALLWSSAGLLIKWIDWDGAAIGGARSALAALVLFLCVRKPKFTWSFYQLGAAFCYAVNVVLFVMATKLTTAANAILLQYTAPIYVALLAGWFLGERTTRFDWLMIGAVFGGIALFFLDNLSAGSLLGNVLGIVCGVTFGLFALFMRKQKDESPLESVLLGNILAALVGLPFMFESVPSAESVLGLILLGVFQLGIPYALYSWAIKYVNALEAMLIAALEPVLNPLWVLLYWGEKPAKWAVVGGVIVIVAVTLRSVVVAKKEESQLGG